MSVKAMGEVFCLDLEPNLKWLLMCIADNADSYGGNAWPSVASLATKSGMSERTVQRCIADLIKTGVLKRVESKRSPFGWAFKLMFMEMEFPEPPRVNTNNCPAALRSEVIEAFERICQYCKEAGGETNGPDNKPWHIDRIIPGSRGGSYAPENITLSCAKCNRQKAAKTLERRPESLLGKGAKVTPLDSIQGCQSDTPDGAKSGAGVVPKSTNRGAKGGTRTVLREPKTEPRTGKESPVLIIARKHFWDEYEASEPQAGTYIPNPDRNKFERFLWAANRVGLTRTQARDILQDHPRWKHWKYTDLLDSQQEIDFSAEQSA